MGGYQLTLLGESYNPLAQLEESRQQSSTSSNIASANNVSSRGKKSRSDSPGQGFRFFQAKRGASQQSLEGLLQPSPPRHSTACCDGVSAQREVERRLSSQKLQVSAASVTRDSETGDSFRSEDSESLALWEEKEPASADQGWMKLTAQSPRWLEAMRRFGRSSPVHPKSPRDTPRASLDRNPSQRSVHESSKSWYGTATKRIRNGESRSVRSPKSAKNLIRQSGELHPPKFSLESGVVSSDSKHGSFSRLTREEMWFSSPAVVWDHSPRREQSKANPPVNPTIWDLSAESLPETEIKFVDANSSKPKVAQPLTDKLVVSCESSSDNHQSEKNLSTAPQGSAQFVNVIDFIAPSMSKLHCGEKKVDDAALIPKSSISERRVPFKWEAPQGKQLRADEVAPATETPQPPPFATKNGVSSPFESLRDQYLIKSKGSPLGGFRAIVPKTSTSSSCISSPRPPRPPTSTVKEEYVTPDLFLTKSRSTNDAGGPLQRKAYNSPDQRLFTKLRKSVFGTARGLSPLGPKNDVGDVSGSSPRSILRGPDDGSVPSSNPSLRSDPGTPAFSAVPTSASQSISSCSASFDLNDSGNYVETTYDLNTSSSAGACIIVESRRVSLSFRDFGVADGSGEDVMAGKVGDVTENVTCNIELLGCESRFESNGLRSPPETMQSPELWTTTFSTRYQIRDSPQSELPERACDVGTEHDVECTSAGFDSPAPVIRAMDAVPPEVQVPIVIQKSRSRNGEFAARLGLVFSPMRFISSHEPGRNCFQVAATLSPPHDDDDDDDDEDHQPPPTYSASLEFTSSTTPELHSSSTKGRKSLRSFTNIDKDGPSSSTRRHPTIDSHTMVVSISKVVKKILSKCTVKRPASKGKSKTDSPVLNRLPPAEFTLPRLSEVQHRNKSQLIHKAT